MCSPATATLSRRAVLGVALIAEIAMQSNAAEADYTIDTIAGNGSPGAFPSAGGLATEVPVDLPFGVENGPDGALYITSVGTHQILRLDPKTQRLSAVAGTGKKGYTGDGGPATEATLNEPYEVRFDSRGNMLILEMQNFVLRRVEAKTGVISTLAGDGTPGYRGDGGPARDARFRDPHALILDRDDNIYLSDLSNNRVRRIDAKTGVIETIAGNGNRGVPEEGGLARENPLLSPQGLCVRGKNLWIASVSGQSVWRLDLKSGRIYRVAGIGTNGHSGDGGDPVRATLDGPRGMMLSGDVLYLPEGESNVIRVIDSKKHRIDTVAGVPYKKDFEADGVPALTAPIWQPHGICRRPDGSLVFSDTRNHRVRRLIRHR
jgi:DNA-binding beta-propeller fold protein YncE